MKIKEQEINYCIDRIKLGFVFDENVKIVRNILMSAYHHNELRNLRQYIYCVKF